MIYYIYNHDDKLIKIGETGRFRVRMLALRRDGFIDAAVLAVHRGGTLEEKKIHRAFNHLRISGPGELFLPAKDLIGFMELHHDLAYLPSYKWFNESRGDPWIFSRLFNDNLDVEQPTIAEYLAERLGHEL